jgi:hypothetical protein
MCYTKLLVTSLRSLHCYAVKFFDFYNRKNAKKEGMVTYANH